MNWAVIGMGGAGRGHAAQIAQTDGMRLVGVFDADQSVASDAAAARGVRAYSSWESLLADPEVVGVTLATPSAFHAEQAVSLLDAGKHVVLEKPFALNDGEAQGIADAARRAGRLALPFHNRRWDPDFRLVLEVARAGTLGEVRVVRSAVGGPSPDSGWRLQRHMGGGRLNDWGPHLFSQIYEWFGGEARAASGYLTTIYPQNECEDLFAAELRFAPDVLVSVMMSGFSHLTPLRWEVIGSEGTLQITGDFNDTFTLAWKRMDGQEFSQTYRRQDIAAPVPIYAGLVAQLEGRGEAPVTLEEGVAVSRWLGAVRASAASGGTQEKVVTE